MSGCDEHVPSIPEALDQHPIYWSSNVREPNPARQRQPHSFILGDLLASYRVADFSLGTGASVSRAHGLRVMREFDVIEGGGIALIRGAFDADRVAGFQIYVLNGVAGGVVAVGAARWQRCVGGPATDRLVVHAEREVRHSAGQIEVLDGDVEAACGA